jgi:hypothetical protein
MKLYSTENSEPVAGFLDRSIRLFTLPYEQIYSTENVEEPFFLALFQSPPLAQPPVHPLSRPFRNGEGNSFSFLRESASSAGKSLNPWRKNQGESSWVKVDQGESSHFETFFYPDFDRETGSAETKGVAYPTMTGTATGASAVLKPSMCNF